MHVFTDFGSLWLPKMPSKSNIFPTAFENVDFVKIVLPSRRELNFQGLEPSENEYKSTQKVTSKKTSEIISQNSFWDSILVSKSCLNCSKF